MSKKTNPDFDEVREPYALNQDHELDDIGGKSWKKRREILLRRISENLYVIAVALLELEE